MKTSTTLMFVAALAAGSVNAADTMAATVTVGFHESDKFTDARSSFGSRTDKYYLDQLSEHLQKVATRQLAPGQKLEIVISDIDLAGDFIPGNASTQDVRIIKEIYIPRVKLFFKLLDADGRGVKEGERKLSDMNFMSNIGLIGRDQPLFYDKAMLSDWVRKELR